MSITIQRNHSSVYTDVDPTNANLSAKGKVILVTGGGRGIGKAIATSFAIAGAEAIIVLGRTSATLETAVKEISTVAQVAGHKIAVQYKVVDISDCPSMKAAFQAVRDEFGHLDVVVSNAADLYKSSLKDSNVEDYWKSMEINIKGTFNTIQAMLQSIASQTSASTKTTFISLTSFGIGMPAFPTWSNYTASKLAAFRLVETLSFEAADSVRAFSVNPGHVATDMSKKAEAPASNDAALPGAFCVWLAATAKADFLQGRYASATWDITELMAQEEKIVNEDLLKMKLRGVTVNL